MQYFLVGNGFDLHHKFPTSYINFLHTIHFLVNNCGESFDNVGQVFGNAELHACDDFIKECYEKHSRIYDETSLSDDAIKKMVVTAKDNIWFKYLCNCVSIDIHWIDFEREISRVIAAFAAFFDHAGKLRQSDYELVFDCKKFPHSVEDRYILEQFNFFFQILNTATTSGGKLAKINKAYVVEKVIGSKLYYVDVEKIVSELYDSMREFAEIMRNYFQLFVDAPSQKYIDLGFKPYWPSVSTPNRVYSFNYTNTFEILYGHNMVDHIHGTTNSKIVLGVNPDEHDELHDIDTTFLQFKKYFQRVFYKTDLSYLRNITHNAAIPRNNDIELIVVGHSLDITDKDIITQVFRMVKKITIYYHRDSSINGLIKNLVNIYGKDGLDQLREVKNLQFIRQADIVWRETAS